MITTIQNNWTEWEPSKDWSAAAFIQHIRNAIDYGHYSVGLEMADAALSQHPANLELRYLKALCCSRSHAQCVPLLEALLNEPTLPVDLRGDALALQGRLYKNQCLYAEGKQRIGAAHNSATQYESALALASNDDQRYFFAINAASMHLMAGDNAKSQAHAEAAISACEANGVDESDYWKLATLGEAACLLGDLQQSHLWYSKARQAAGDRFGNVGSMRSQLLMLSGVRDVKPLLDDALALPTVAAFAGHMIDAAGAEPRFPAGAEPSVAAAISQALKEENVQFGYSSAACGGDLLFIEALQAKRAEANITLPFAYDDFLETSVSYAGEQWPKRLDAALQKAASVHYATSERFLGDSVLFEYTNSLFMGAAILRAKQMATTPILIAALRKGSTAKIGGTQSTVSYWKSLGLPHKLVEIDAHEPGPIAPPISPAKAESPQPAANHIARKVRTILFADVTGFSRMGETEAPLFVEHFLGASAALLDNFQPAPEFVNTWGDGIYMVFETLEAGADFALALRDMVKQTDWTLLGLPDHTGIRIALHCGPVFPALEPMTKRPNFFGTHVTRAARIEPVTMPGSVYLTEQAAFLLVSSPDQRFQCDDLGKVELAKKYGAEHIFRLRRTGEWE